MFSVADLSLERGSLRRQSGRGGEMQWEIGFELATAHRALHTAVAGACLWAIDKLSRAGPKYGSDLHAKISKTRKPARLLWSGLFTRFRIDIFFT
jgi:hypothetical protein